MYAFVQAEYWNVGLFRYYEVKQVRVPTCACLIVYVYARACDNVWVCGSTYGCCGGGGGVYACLALLHMYVQLYVPVLRVPV